MHLIILFLLTAYSTWAQVSLPPDLSTIAEAHPYEISKSRNFNLALINGYCDSGNVVDRRTALTAINFFQSRLDPSIEQVKRHLADVENDSLELFEKKLPLEIQLSVDGDEECINATTFDNLIKMPIIKGHGMLERILEIFQHEIGHTVAEAHSFQNELYSEAIADMMSLILRHKPGVLGGIGNSELMRFEHFISLADTDPIALSKETGVILNAIPFIAERMKYISQCMSSEWGRDFSRSLNQDFLYYSGFGKYEISCWLMSNIFSNSQSPYEDIKKIWGILLQSHNVGISIAQELMSAQISIPELEINQALSQNLNLSLKQDELKLSLVGNEKLLLDSKKSPLIITIHKNGVLAELFEYPSYSHPEMTKIEACSNIKCYCPNDQVTIKVFVKKHNYNYQSIEIPKMESCYEIY